MSRPSYKNHLDQQNIWKAHIQVIMALRLILEIVVQEMYIFFIASFDT